MAKKLFLFRPGPGWTYCGGATLIAASSWEEAIEIGNALKNSGHEIGETDAHDVGFVKEGLGTGVWTPVEEFELANERPAGLVYSDANHA